MSSNDAKTGTTGGTLRNDVLYLPLIQPGAQHSVIDIVIKEPLVFKRDGMTEWYTLGKDTPNGIEVLNSDGNVVMELTHNETGVVANRVDLFGTWELALTIDYTVYDKTHSGAKGSTLTMKPESMKKSSVAKATESGSLILSNRTVERPTLIVGDNLIEVDIDNCTDDALKSLRREWFWKYACQKPGGKRSTISYFQALGQQRDLIEVAKTFIGVRVYLAEVAGHQYRLPIVSSDDLALLCLLDRNLWKETDTVYPSVLEEWEYDASGDKVTVVHGLRSALLLQNDLQIRKPKAAYKTSSTQGSPTPPAKTRKRTSKKPTSS